MADILTILAQKLPVFRVHCFIKVKQSDAFHMMPTIPVARSAVLLVDLSENANIVDQDEVHEATATTRWSPPPTLAFPMIIYCSSDD